MKGVSLFLPSSAESFPMDAARLPKKIAMPVSIFLDNARLEGVDIHQGEKSHEIERIHLSARADKQGISFEKFNAYAKDMRFALSGHGSLQQPYPFEIKLDWRAMLRGGSIPLKGECYIEGDMREGRASIRLGAPLVLETNVELKANKDWTDLAVIGNGKQKDVRPSNPVEIPYLGGRPRINFNQIEFQTLGGRITLQGFMNWQPEPVLDLSIHGKNIDPGVLLPDWPGKLEFQSRLQGGISNETIKASFSELKLQGRLLDLPFESSGSLTFQDNQPKLVDLDIRSGKNQLKLNGASEKNQGLQFELEVLEPAKLWPGLEGQWHGNGFVKQIDGNPVGTLVLQGNDVTYGNFHIESYHGNFACESIDTQKCSARVKLTNLRVNDDVFPSLSIDWMGDFKNHRVRADLVSSTARTNLEFKGECYSDTWKFRIDNASFDLENNGTWHLNNHPVNVLVDNTGIKPFKACWSQKDSSVCVDGSWSTGEGWKTEGDLNAPPLNRMIDILKVLIQRPKLDKKFYKTGDINYE
jgi:hypothetical protein